MCEHIQATFTLWLICSYLLCHLLQFSKAMRHKDQFLMLSQSSSCQTYRTNLYPAHREEGGEQDAGRRGGMLGALRRD